MKNNMKRVRISLVITAAVIVISLIGIITELVKNGTWDAAGCSVLACNCCIFCCNYPVYQKLRDGNNK